MNRVRWFHASLPVGLRALASKLEAYPLALDGESGFRVEKLRSQSLEAVYFERHTTTEHLVDPFGRESALERTAYKSLRFIVCNRYPELELVDAQRGLKSFLSRVAEITSFEAVVEPLTIDVLAWARAINSGPSRSLRVGGISVADLNVENGITGKLALSSREHDVEGALTRLLARRTYSVQKVQLTFTEARLNSSIVLSSDGSIRSDREIPVDVLSEIRSAVPRQP